MTPAQRAKRDAAAEAIGNDLSPVRDIECPRTVKNPGAYFGAIRGYDACFAEMQKRVEELELVAANLQMVCRRLSVAKTIEKRDAVSKQCRHLFEGSALRTTSAEGEGNEDT